MKLVIKFAGALLEDKMTVQALAGQISSLAKQGHEIWSYMEAAYFHHDAKRLGIESKFVAGLRVTIATRDVAVMVFAGF